MAKEWLKKEEYLPFAPSVRGEQVNTFHCKKGRGNDRLYIRRSEDDSILAYCHHCGKRGYDNNSHLENARNTPITNPSDRDILSAISGSQAASRASIINRWENAGKFPTDYGTISTKEWALRAGIGEADLKKLGVREFDGRVWFPSYDTDGKVAWLHGRASIPDMQPKWYKVQLSNKKVRAWGTGKVLILVEDIMSAYRVSECGYSALPLFSTSLGKEYLTSFGKYDIIYVWLDNDNPQVLSNRMKIKHKLNLLYDNVKVIKDKQPKDLTSVQIQEIIDENS